MSVMARATGSSPLGFSCASFHAIGRGEVLPHGGQELWFGLVNVAAPDPLAVPDLAPFPAGSGTLAGMPKSAKATGESEDWRAVAMARLSALIHEADPDIVVEQKWKKASNPDGVPLWSHDGMVCTGEIYKTHVKVTFARGASLKDPSGLFNSSLEGNTRRAIDWQEGDKINERAFKALIKEAVAFNVASRRK
jgi:hypothetical protein